MLIKQEVLQQIRLGKVRLAFRRWQRPTVKAGGTLKTSVGILSIDGVEPVTREKITEQDAKQAGAKSLRTLLGDLDGRSEGVLYRIILRWVGEDPRAVLRVADELDEKAMAALREQLANLDRRSKAGSWTLPTLELIGSRDGVTAAEIADRHGLEKAALKLKVRKLKELGLTESLASGYRLSPRGRTFLKAIKKRR